MRHRMAMKMIEEHDSRSEWKDHERKRKQMNTDDIRDGLKDCLNMRTEECAETV